MDTAALLAGDGTGAGDTGSDDVGAGAADVADVAVVGLMLAGTIGCWAAACDPVWWETTMTVTTAITATQPAADQAIAVRRFADGGAPRDLTLHLDPWTLALRAQSAAVPLRHSG